MGSRDRAAVAQISWTKEPAVEAVWGVLHALDYKGANTVRKLREMEQCNDNTYLYFLRRSINYRNIRKPSNPSGDAGLAIGITYTLPNY